MDTAGFRKVKGEVEKIGINLTKEKLASADLSLIVIDQSRPLNQDDLNIIAQAEKKKSLILINKVDLATRMSEDELDAVLDGMRVVKISALTGEGIDGLRKAIRDHIITADVDSTSSRLAPNLRHRAALTDAFKYFSNAYGNMREGLPLEVIALDLNSGLEALGEIIGETTNDEIIDKIFSDFCLGK
jgi:tRNA modification GTPase